MYRTYEQFLGPNVLYVYVEADNAPKIGPLTKAVKAFIGRTAKTQAIARKRAQKLAEQLNREIK